MFSFKLLTGFMTQIAGPLQIGATSHVGTTVSISYRKPPYAFLVIDVKPPCHVFCLYKDMVPL